ncbi:MAG: N-acetylmuramoyl-L-alanine amidase [Elainellaceae cyanobacterium]
MLKRLGLALLGATSLGVIDVIVGAVEPPESHFLGAEVLRRVSPVAYSAAYADQPEAENPSSLSVVYPPENHETTAEQIFLIGTAPSDGTVMVNGEAIERSPAGHFAPSFPLAMGENRFTLTYGDQTLEMQVQRVSIAPPVPEGIGFVSDRLYPSIDIARQPGELICFEAIAPIGVETAVRLRDQRIALMPQADTVVLPPNSAVLTLQNQPLDISSAASPTPATTYQGCGSFAAPGSLGTPVYELLANGQRITQAAAGTIEILSPTQVQIAEVTGSYGAARTGPSTNYSRLTPLPTGTQAAVTGRDDIWYRLDYGAWIRDTDVTVRPGAVPPRSLIRSVRSQPQPSQTEVFFPLQVPVPVSVEQESDTFTLILHNTTAQTDTIFIGDDPLIRRMDWTQPNPDEIRYTFHLKTDQQWGYDLRYEGTTLVLTLRHAPNLSPSTNQPLQGISVLLDPGHGGEELGSRGPTGYPEKAVNLVVSRLLRDQLIARGATVYMTRDEDVAVSLGDRIDLINQLEPTIALSIHYNALPDSGDAVNTAGVGAFWYDAQAHDLALFLHDYLVETRDRPSYGVFWNNLALTRPSIAPSVLLELGFMINPNEFEWIVDPEEQQALAIALADGIAAWIEGSRD